MGQVVLACYTTNHQVGLWPPDRQELVELRGNAVVLVVPTPLGKGGSGVRSGSYTQQANKEGEGDGDCLALCALLRYCPCCPPRYEGRKE